MAEQRYPPILPEHSLVDDPVRPLEAAQARAPLRSVAKELNDVGVLPVAVHQAMFLGEKGYAKNRPSDLPLKMQEDAHVPLASSEWMPGRPPYGFKVQMLPERPAPLNARHAFATRAEFAGDIEGRYETKNGVRLLAPGEACEPGEALIDINMDVSVQKMDFDEAIKEGRLARELADQEEFVHDSAVSNGLVGAFPRQEDHAVRSSINYEVVHHYEPDWHYFSGTFLERQTVVSQIVSFEMGGKQTSLYNFTNTQLSEEHISKIANALRAVGDRTGGAILDMLDIMAVVPNDDALLALKDGKGEFIRSNQAATVGGNVLLSEGLFNEDAPYPDVTAPLADEEDLLREVDQEHPLHVEGDGLQLAVVHELTHVTADKGSKREVEATEEFAKEVGWEQDDNGNVTKRGYTDSHAVYGRSSPEEDIPVTAEADFVGGEWAGYYADRRVALGGLWKRRHSGMYGPSFVTAVEQPLPQPPNKISARLDDHIALRPKYSYRVHN